MKNTIVMLAILALSPQLLAYIPISDERRSELLMQFQYTPEVQVHKFPQQVGCKAQDVHYDTTYPQRETPYRVQAQAYVPNKANVPVVFMLPPLGGSNQLDRAMAMAFCRSNIAAFVILNDFTGLDSNTLMPVSDHDHTPRRVVASVKGGILVAQGFPNINTRKVGLFGASLGGILGSIAYGVMPEVSAATFIVNGGDVPNTLAYSDQQPIIRIKRGRMAAENLKNEAEYEHYLNQHITLDPLHFAPLIVPESIKLYLSRNDKAVPSANQMAFYKAVGSPKETGFYTLDHGFTIFAVLGVGDQKQAITNWFHGRFALPNPRDVAAPFWF